MTAQTVRQPEADTSSGLTACSAFLTKMHCMNLLNMGLHDLCQQLIQLGAQEDVWLEVTQYYRWDQFDREVLRTLAHLLAPCEAAEAVLIRLIQLRVLYLEDYTELRDQIVSPRARWEALFAVWEAAKSFGKSEYGRTLISEMHPQQHQIGNTSEPYVPGEGGNLDPATYARWYAIMHGC